jgi:hypothetical protein
MSTLFVDCALCSKLAQKIEARDEQQQRLIPAEANQLVEVVAIDDPDTHRYETNHTWLLKCPRCGTHYYKNHHVDEGEHFMDSKCNDLVIRRYDPVTTLDFLERIVSSGALPNPLGRLTKALWEGSGAPNSTAPRESKSLEAAQNELEQVRSHLVAEMASFSDALRDRKLDSQVQTYLADALLFYFSSKRDWPSLHSHLLAHPDPFVRGRAAGQAMGIGTGDNSVLDSWHTPRAVHNFLSYELRKKERMDELVRLLLGVIREGNTNSREPELKTRVAALYSLIVAVSHGADLGFALPELFDLLGLDPSTTRNLCWLFGRAAEENLRAKNQILKLFEEIPPPRKNKLLANEDVQRFIARCAKAEPKPKSKPKPKPKPKPTPKKR